jgi:hypothetical protein
MKSRTLRLIAVGLFSAMASVAQALPITYDLVNFTNGTDTLTGSITTDGTIGGIFNANVLAWSFTDTGPLAFSISSANPNVFQCKGSAGCFTASPSTLAFNFLATTDPNDPFALFIAATTPLQGLITFANALGSPDAIGRIAVTAFNPTFGSWSVDGPPNGVFAIGGGATSVPEPGTLSLFAAGLIALGLMRRRVAA